MCRKDWEVVWSHGFENPGQNSKLHRPYDPVSTNLSAPMMGSCARGTRGRADTMALVAKLPGRTSPSTPMAAGSGEPNCLEVAVSLELHGKIQIRVRQTSLEEARLKKNCGALDGRYGWLDGADCSGIDKTAAGVRDKCMPCVCDEPVQNLGY